MDKIKLSNFQTLVYDATKQIPIGKITTYGQIAKKLINQKRRKLLVKLCQQILKYPN
jgi:O6-methylguanine-DNA--protein-cysteine methyltransferase